MDEADGYTGPRLECGPRTKDAVRRRIRDFVAARTTAIHGVNVRAWAKADDGAYPDRREAHREAMAEVELLCTALGLWAAVNPGDLLADRWQPPC